MQADAYCPVDISMPAERVADIIDAVSPEIVLAAEESALDLLPQDGGFFLMPPRVITETADGITDPQQGYELIRPVSGEETFYIMFTSGQHRQAKGR